MMDPKHYTLILVFNLIVLLDLKVNGYPVPMTLVTNAAAKGAVCLDGSAPAYHFSPGFGSGANNWLVHMEVVHLKANEYWRAPFLPLMASRQMVEYVVIDVEMGTKEVYANGSKYCLADVHVGRVSDFGRNDTMFIVKTHLGHLLSPGDYALGYDMHTANYNNSQVEKYPEKVIQGTIQDVYLIKKSYEEKRQKRKGKQRPWKLKSLGMEVNEMAARGRADKVSRGDEYEEFLKDFEENPEMRFDISLYRNEDYRPSEMASTVGNDDVPTVPLDELLAELELSDKEGSDDENDDESIMD